ncbi:Fc.00g006260.m01.CDS01 [Cosmosporella sp. VM-42]
MVPSWEPSRPESLSTQLLRWSADPQESCPFYGILPAEIRLLIFTYTFVEEEVWINSRNWALSGIATPKWLLRELPEGTREPEAEDSDLEGFELDYYIQHGQHPNELRDRWLRPGCTGWRTQYPALLRTCRRIFMEARDLLIENTTRRVFCDNATAPPHFGKLGFDQDMFRFSHYTANRITKYHLYVPLENLIYGYLSENHLAMRSARDIRLTIRKTDWGADSSLPPEITPYGSGNTANGEHPQRRESMKEHMRLTQGYNEADTGLKIPAILFKHGYDVPIPWGECFSRFSRLEKLTMDFEHSEDRFYQLLEIAEWARRVWRFRLGGHMKGYYLSAATTLIRKTSWRGLAADWDRKCPNHRDRNVEEDHHEDEGNIPLCCGRCRRLIGKGIGPRMYTFTVSWIARKLDPGLDNDPSILQPEDLCDWRNEQVCDGILKRPDLIVF